MDEEWRDIQGYEEHYQVSNFGRIKSLIGFDGHKYIKREKILTISIDSKGDYKRCQIILIKNKVRKTFKVHRLVAIAFIENKNNYKCINHKDSNALNNHFENLEWCTQKQNMQHASINDRLGKTKINKSELEYLHHKQLKSIKEISCVMNINYCIVLANMREYKIKILKRSKTFGLKLDLEFLENELKTKTQNQIAFELGCTQSNISHMYKRLKTRRF